MRFEWDDEKNEQNYKKHEVWFEEAQTIWADELAQEFFDPEHSSREDRFIRVGHSTRERLLLVVFCEIHDDAVRLISARRATNRERNDYEEGI